MIIEQCQDVEQLKPLGESWLQELKADEFGLNVDLDVIIQDLKRCVLDTEDSAILVAKDGGGIVGVFAVFAVPSYLGRQKMAVEKYWFTKEHHNVAGPRLYVEAVNWAKKYGCSHLITSGSKMASDRHDSICRFLEKTGARHFETSYIYTL